MIGYIHGQVHELHAPVVILLTNQGIGYEVELPLPTFCQLVLNETIGLYTHLVVREDAHLLYGFLSQTDKQVFRTLIRITGVGAKLALAMLSTLTVTELKQAVEHNNAAALTRIPGIGKKTAERLLIELRDKLDFIAEEPSDFAITKQYHPSSNQAIEEAQAALISLGYNEKEAKKAVATAQPNNGNNPLNTQNLLKAALKQLLPNR